ncbi:MAG: alpha/beta hydrolase-fold protein [Anaerolineales bacterium]
MPDQSRGIHLEKAVGQKYTIYIPHRYTQGEAVPLVLLLHWGGKKHRYIGREILEQLGVPALTELEAILVAPDRKRRHWATPNAEKDMVRLLAYLDEHYRLQPGKRVLAGYSVGGVGVWYLASQRPDLFSCGVVMAAPPPEHLLGGKWDFPLYTFYSELDEVVPFESTKEQIEQLQQKGAPIRFVPVGMASHADVRDYLHPFQQTIPWILEHLSS